MFNMNDKSKTLEFIKSEKFSLKRHPKYNEKWLQVLIENNPDLLGLGELEVVERERIQSSGGRLDYLLRDADNNMLYEVEIQLGSTDPSHIIRTIEYWDIEKRRNPNYEHRAVIVAEEITNRFFNVIYLMNRAIPIIAIQLNALIVNDKLTLNFTKVLDLYEPPEDEIESKIETVDENFWRNKSSPESFKINKNMISKFTQIYPNGKVTYNRWHIALGTEIRNCIWLRPRKSNFVSVEIKVTDDKVEEFVNKLGEIGLTPTKNKNRRETTNLIFPVKNSHIEQNEHILSEILKEVVQMST